MKKTSAGIVAYRWVADVPEVLLVHPGGPFYVRKDAGVWSIPKGEFTTEDPLAAACREFEEELGQPISGHFFALAPVRQKGGKHVYAFAVAADIDVTVVRSNMFELEFPPRSGNMQQYPEVDRAQWFSLPEARRKLNPAQGAFIDELEQMLHRGQGNK